MSTPHTSRLHIGPYWGNIQEQAHRGASSSPEGLQRSSVYDALVGEATCHVRCFPFKLYPTSFQTTTTSRTASLVIHLKNLLLLHVPSLMAQKTFESFIGSVDGSLEGGCQGMGRVPAVWSCMAGSAGVQSQCLLDSPKTGSYFGLGRLILILLVCPQSAAPNFPPCTELSSLSDPLLHTIPFDTLPPSPSAPSPSPLPRYPSLTHWARCCCPNWIPVLLRLSPGPGLRSPAKCATYDVESFAVGGPLGWSRGRLPEVAALV